MAGNTFGTLFKITTFGESHGEALGVVIDGCPPQLKLDIAAVQHELNRRKPGQSALTTSRSEAEKVEILSGVFEGITTGAPLTMLVRNTNQRSQDYDTLKEVFRPSHADYTYIQKYGIRDHRGSGRASARETVARVMAGAVAKQVLNQYQIQIRGYVNRVATIAIQKPYTELDLTKTELNAMRCPDEEVAKEMMDLVAAVKEAGDSVGGTIACVVTGVPAGWGEPVFDKLHAELGKAMLSINACKGFEIGSGFEGTRLKGSEHNDAFVSNGGKITTQTNHSGGVQGGISNGADLYFQCAFKPVSSIAVSQATINTSGEPVTLETKGRHDPCVLPRAVPIVEAMAAIVLVDLMFRAKASNAVNLI
ncbi:MAG: chorismate synthase [Bacteroidia bacterium]|jgi:chorismate synthase|nr:chorismate synthase [Bacteroidia bacterium]